MTAIYRIPLATELAYLEKKVAAEHAEVLMGLVRACYALALALALGPGPSKAEAGPFMPSLTHPDPAVWGPAFVYMEPLLPRFPGLRAAVQGLLDHPDPAVRLRLLHWQEWPFHEADDRDTDDGQAVMMLQPDWRDGREPLAMVGGFEIFCPMRHLLLNRKTWMS